MTVVLRRRVLVALVAALALVLAGAAQGAIVTSHDDAGRAINFDVRAPNVDTEWYASVLRAAAHGNEISAVTIRIVPEPQIPALCGGEDAAACYTTGSFAPPTIILPAGKSRLLESTILHEYGHHLDSYWHVTGSARAERHGRMVASAQHGVTRGEPSGRVRLLARLGSQRRRDLRGGLRLHPHP